MGSIADALSGRWTSDWGEVRIEVKGGALTGTWAEGGLTGSVAADGAVSLTWSHRDGTTGKASLSPDKDGGQLAGTWGFGDDDKGEGAWSLTQVERAAAPEPAPAPAEEPTAGDAPAGDPPAEDGEAPADGKKKKK